MASPSSNPFYGSGAGNSPANSGYQRMALDNLIRRELKVSDPNDPQQIANALLERFKEDPRAKAISQEARGLPFLLSAGGNGVPVVQAANSSDAELQQAKDDVNRDLQELLTNSLLKDVTPEIQGWAQAVRTAITEGTTAARFALDPRQRDKAFAIRRQLGDYARMARLVGALTPTMNLVYRKFAQSLDEVAAVILVTMGEALANVGFNGGRFLLQAPYSELQVRRDAVIYALRNLIGATQEAYGPNEWPRGLDAYRLLFQHLERHGQGDLRSLLLETELARTMDELIQRAAHGRAEGLRALGSTAQLDLERFRRMVTIGERAVNIESPPLTAFLEALQLFADAFEHSGGFRLIRVARPPITLYGLYGIGGLDDADQRLLHLIIQRGLLAERLDCYLGGGFDIDRVTCQVVLDKILYDVDRAIDLYAVGKDDFGQAERRAAAYSLIIESFKSQNCVDYPSLDETEDLLAGPERALGGTRNKARSSDERKWIGALKTYAKTVSEALSGANLPGSDDLVGAIGVLPDESGGEANVPFDLLDLALVSSLAQKGEVLLSEAEPPVTIQLNSGMRSTVNAFNELFDVNGLIDTLRQELCIQKDAEGRWKNLVKTMAPNCLGIDDIFRTVETVINSALKTVGDLKCPVFGPTVPPHPDTSLEALVRTPRLSAP